MTFRNVIAGLLVAMLMVAGAAWAGGKIDVNTATAEQLQSVNGIGVKTAAAIIAYREAHGAFKNVEDMVKVKGIGKKKLAKIEDEIEAGDEREDRDKHENKDKHDD